MDVLSIKNPGFATIPKAVRDLLARKKAEMAVGVADGDLKEAYAGLPTLVKQSASMVFLPSHFKGGKIYGLTGQDFNFSRSSNAMVVGKDGLLQYAPHNLLQRSEEFDNAVWSKSDTIINANNIIAPDGTLTADLITEGSIGNAAISQAFTGVANTTYTFSKYIKRGNHNWVRLTVSDTGNNFNYAWFDLLNGVKGSVSASAGGLPTSNMISVGDGWFRCSITVSFSGTLSSIYSISATNDLSSARVINSTRYEWGAQLNAGSKLLDYVQTTSAAVYAPRFQYDPVTKKYQGLLMEKASTNLLTYSEKFDDATWSKTDVVVSGGQVAPDGNNSAFLVTEGSAGTSNLNKPTTVSANTTITGSFYIKKGNTDWVRVRLSDSTGNNGCNAWFNLATGQKGAVAMIGTATGFVTNIEILGNGWFRCSLSGICSATDTTAVFQSMNATGDTFTARVNNATRYMWGAQLEQSAVPTSYIPTLGSSVTRATETCVNTNMVNWYNASEGAVYSQYASVDSGTKRVFSINDGTVNNGIYQDLSSFNVISGGVSQAAITGGSASGKIGSAYKANDFAFVKDGTLKGTDTSGTIPTVSQVNIGGSVAAGNEINGTVKAIAYFNTRRTNSELQNMTL